MGPTKNFQKMLEELLINHYSIYIQKSCSFQYVLLPTMCKGPWAISVAGREVTVVAQLTIWSSGEWPFFFERTDFWELLLQKERSQSWMKSGRGTRLERAVNMKSLPPECPLQEAPGLGSQLSCCLIARLGAKKLFHDILGLSTAKAVEHFCYTELLVFKSLLSGWKPKKIESNVKMLKL